MGVQATAFRMLAETDVAITGLLEKVSDTPIKVVATGVSMFAAAFTLVWGIYKCYNILMGAEPQPLLPFFKDLAIKMLMFVKLILLTQNKGTNHVK